MKIFTIFILLSAIVGGLSSAYAQSKHPVPSTRYMSDALLITNGQQEWLSPFKKQKTFTIPAKETTSELKTKSLIALYDSIYHWEWDTLTNGWAGNPYYKEINFVYDANNNLTSELDQNWDGTAWVNNWQYTSTYDANNNLTSTLRQNWSDTAWVNYWQSTYTYDANNNQTSTLRQNWNGTVWVNSSQYTYTYDANNNQTSALGQSWNGTAWVNSWLYTSTYDVNNNLTIRLGQNWFGAAWVNFWQYTYTYDVNNNLTSELRLKWNGTTWVNYWQSTYTYDVNNFKKCYTYKYWNSTGTAINSGDSSIYYFHTITGVNELMAQNENIIIYPNPATDIVTLNINNANNKDLEINIYDITGTLVKSEILKQNQQKINIGDLSNGVYMVSIKSKDLTENQRLIIQR